MAELLDALKPYLEFERAQWTKGPVEDDGFYQTPPYGPEDRPGKVLRVGECTDTTKYLLPGGVALSRFIYHSETVHGVPIPVSAFIIWPYSPRRQRDDKYPVVAWAHGTSGIAGDGAPSHHKNLWQHFLGPYQIALNGYVGVATDYAGLGVFNDSSGAKINHPYLCSTSHAHDVVHSVIAAQTAFPALSKDFVVIGHSQGGGAAWGVAQREAISPTPGCLGSIAVSPVTSFLEEPGPFGPILAAGVSNGVKSTFPDANLSDFLTPSGEERMALIQDSKVGLGTLVALMLGADLVKPNFREDPHLRAYAELCAAGGRPIGCPLLVIHGLSDPKVNAAGSHKAALRTAEMFPDASITYIGLPGVSHDPAMYVGQSRYMDWIADRFAGKPTTTGFVETTLDAARPIESYKEESNWYLAPVTEPYHAP